MQLDIVGLGRMGANMTRRLACGGQACVVIGAGDVIIDSGNSCYHGDTHRAEQFVATGGPVEKTS